MIDAKDLEAMKKLGNHLKKRLHGDQAAQQDIIQISMFLLMLEQYESRDLSARGDSLDGLFKYGMTELDKIKELASGQR